MYREHRIRILRDIDNYIFENGEEPKFKKDEEFDAYIDPNGRWAEIDFG